MLLTVRLKKPFPPKMAPQSNTGSLRTRSLARPPQPVPASLSRAHARNDAHWLSIIQHARMPHTMWCTVLPALLMSAMFAQNTLHASHAQLLAIALAMPGKHARIRPSMRARSQHHCAHAARHASKAANAARYIYIPRRRAPRALLCEARPCVCVCVNALSAACPAVFLNTAGAPPGIKG